jgi:hypothetical protein
MAAESGYDFQAYYVDMGQDVAKKEWETVQNIASEYHFSDRLQKCTKLIHKTLFFFILPLALELRRGGLSHAEQRRE